MLLGDPALTLAFPEYKVVTDSINNVYIENVNYLPHVNSPWSVHGICFLMTFFPDEIPSEAARINGCARISI